MSDIERRGSRLLDGAAAILLAAMALYGAVFILQSIWIWLCVSAAFIGAVTACACLIRSRQRWR